MALFKKKEAEQVPPTAFEEHDTSVGTAADVEAVMKKYDRESNTRVWEGMPKLVIRWLMVAFSLYCIIDTVFLSTMQEIRLPVFVGLILLFGFLTFPARKGDTRVNHMPWYDIILLIIGPGAYFFYAVNAQNVIQMSARVMQNDLYMVIGLIGILALVELCRRSTGIPLIVVVGLFTVYGAWWLTNNNPKTALRNLIYNLFYNLNCGIFSSPITVCASFIVLFIILGSFLEKTGIGTFFVDLANSIAGASVGGPAKVAVLASGFFGTISGSSVANTVSTGTFTIPLMKSVGYRGAFAGAVEAASSTGGQIMPPIMGAAAFIMAQFLGVGYVEIAKAALVPALLYYLAVGFMVHMEAKRLGLKGIPKERLPRTWVVLRQGGYLLIPIIVLIYMLMQGYTPLKAAYYCIVTTVVISLVAENWKTWHGARYSNENVMSALAQTNFLSLKGVLQAMENGGRLALGVAAACACTGFVIGVVTLTGLGLKLANAILTISADSFALTLLLTMLASIVLGMGLPTTAKYIVLATIAAPAIMHFGVPAMAAHLFILYFGILADLTPPVALAAYAAAGIARSEPNATGFMAVKLALAGFLIPYIFCYNPGLLMIGASGWEVLFYASTAALGIASLSFASVGYWLRNLYWWERLILLAGAITLITPGAITDAIGCGLLVVIYISQKMLTSGPVSKTAG